LNLFDLIPKDLSSQLFNIINSALKTKKEIVSKDITLLGEKKIENMQVRVIPVVNEWTDVCLILVVFERIQEDILPKGLDNNKKIDELRAKRIKELENELKGTKESLQATVEELETSNEELQATNEELVASNEELQSTNEELQSVNEELYTVNSEYQEKIEELTSMNNDFDNLLTNSNIGIIFLDINKKIRLFTPAVKIVVNLIDSDIGRPFDHISSRVDKTILDKNVDKVLNTLIPFEKEMRSDEGKTFVIRMVPYRTTENKIEGIVITFNDITQIRSFEKKLIINQDLKIIMDYNPAGAMLLDENGKIIYANKKVEEILGFKKEILERSNYDSPSFVIKNNENKKEKIENYPFNIIMKTKKELKHYKQIIKREDGNFILVKVSGVPIFDDNKKIINIVFLLDLVKKSKSFNTIKKVYDND